MEENTDDAATPTAKLPKCERKRLKKAIQSEKKRVKRRTNNIIKRHALQDKRREFLQSMTLDERRDFILKERADKINHETALIARLERNKTEGNLHVAIAMDYMHLMTLKEQGSLAKQIQWFWNAIVRDDALSVKLDLTSFDSSVEVICRKFGFVNWRMNLIQSRFFDHYDPANIIVLSPDADEVLSEDEILDQTKVFVIGGLVDKTVIKGTTKNVALEHNLSCRRLPIKELSLAIQPILNINTVAEILCEVRFKSQSLKDAIVLAVPPRKVAIGQKPSKQKRRAKKYGSADECESSQSEIESNPLICGGSESKSARLESEECEIEESAILEPLERSP